MGELEEPLKAQEEDPPQQGEEEDEGRVFPHRLLLRRRPPSRRLPKPDRPGCQLKSFGPCLLEAFRILVRLASTPSPTSRRTSPPLSTTVAVSFSLLSPQKT